MGQKTNVAQRISYDIRDGNSYRVRKLADRNCWMTENLRLEFDGNTTYDSSTTNLAPGTTITPSATQARTAAPTAQEIAEWADQNGYNVWRSRSTQGKRESDTGTSYPSGENQLLGVYYNWYTAAAGSVQFPITDSFQFSSYDICPSGWILPGSINNQSSSWRELLVGSYGIEELYPGGAVDSSIILLLHSRPLSAIFSGAISATAGGRTGYQGTAGAFWLGEAYKSGTTYAAHNSNHHLTGGPHVWSYGGNSIVSGYNIRCVAR